jgi:RimJ/RimL family protein N-acetyltransferase
VRDGALVPQSDCRLGRVRLEPLEPGDRATLLAVFDGLSARSRALRFHGAKPRLSSGDLDYLADTGGARQRAVVAVEDGSGRPVGVARFVRLTGDARLAELAFEVVDRCQRSGIGRRLLEQLRAVAVREGVDRFRALVLPGNEAALAVLAGLGRVTRSSWNDGAYELDIDLQLAA